MKVFAKNLFFHESLHFMSGFFLFFSIYFAFGQFSLAVLAFVVSVFIDVDHYLEDFLVNGLNLRRLFTLEPGNYWVKTGKITIFLHCWEILPLVLFFGGVFRQWNLAFAVFLPLFTHYVIDAVLYVTYKKMSIFHYFFLYRLYHRFSFNKICQK